MMDKIQENRNRAQFDYVFRTVEERGVRSVSYTHLTLPTTPYV